MSEAVLSAVILGVSTVAGAVLGGILARSNTFEALFRRSRFVLMVGKWDSRWVDSGDPNKGEQREVVEIDKQKGSWISGTITKQDEPNKKWKFEGKFSGQFLQIMYYPANGIFIDYGCYFLRLYRDYFKGYSVGYEWDKDSIIVSEHTLTKIT